MRYFLISFRIIKPSRSNPCKDALRINQLTIGSAPNVNPATAFDLESFNSKNKSLIKFKPSPFNDTGLQFK